MFKPLSILLLAGCQFALTAASQDRSAPPKAAVASESADTDTTETILEAPEVRARAMVAEWEERLGSLEDIARSTSSGQLPDGAAGELQAVVDEMELHVATGHEELLARALRLGALIRAASEEKGRGRVPFWRGPGEAVRVARLLWSPIVHDLGSFGALGAALERGLEADERRTAKLRDSATKMRTKKSFVPPRRLGVNRLRYPPAAKAAALEAHVEVRYLVEDDGTPVVLDVPTAGVPTSLLLAAVSAVGEWTFEPATVGGDGVPAESTITFEFKDQ